MAVNGSVNTIVTGGLATTPANAMSQTQTALNNIITYNGGPISYNRLSMKTVYNGTTINYLVNAWVSYYSAT